MRLFLWHHFAHVYFSSHVAGADLADIEDSDLVSMGIFDEHLRQRLLSEAKALVSLGFWVGVCM